MKYGVNRQILLIIAGTVWIIAGGNILRIGIVTWMNNSHDWMFKIGEATIVFLLFFVLIFKRLYYKHTRRIEQKKETRNCPFSFFDVKSWIIMIFMISLGAAIIVTGKLVATPGTKQPFEIQAEKVEVEGPSTPDYPLR